LDNPRITNYNEKYWFQIEELIIGAENFGETFLNHEKKIINTFQNNPEYGKVFLALDSQTDKVLGYSSIEIGWRSLIINHTSCSSYLFTKRYRYKNNSKN
jgi:hypothetical protein